MIIDFRIIDDDDPFYDLLINFQIQVEHTLFIHPIRYSLCQFNSQGLIDVIAPINNSYKEEKLVCIVRYLKMKTQLMN